MGNFLNLKSVFTADTKDLKAGAKEAKQAVKDFDDATTEVLDNVTSLFGASMKEIDAALSTARGGFMKFKAEMVKATAGTTGMVRALKVLKTAMIGTGIGAVVVALGSLVAYFTQSQRGANQLRIVTDQLGQAFKVVGDWAIKAGEWIVKAFTEGIRWATKLFNAVQMLTGKINLSSKDTGGEDNVFKRRYDLTQRQIALEEREIELITHRAQLQNKISELRLKAEDRLNYTAEQRLAFQNEAIRLTKELAGLNMAYAQEELAILQENNALSESKNKDLKAEAEKQAEILGLETQQNTQLKEMVTKQAELTTQVEKERQERERIALLNERKKTDLTLKPIDSSKLLENVPVTTAIKPTIDTSGIQEGVEEVEGYMVDFQQIAVDFSNTIADAFASMIEGLVTGDLNMKDIFSTVLSFLAENLKAIGKALMAYGAAMLAFKMAVKDPVAAIAVGAALVAAGAVLSGLIKNMSSGGGESVTPSAAYAAATVSGGSTLDLTSKTQAQAQQQEVKVTGTIKASGRDLAIILENEKQRKKLTA